MVDILSGNRIKSMSCWTWHLSSYETEWIIERDSTIVFLIMGINNGAWATELPSLSQLEDLKTYSFVNELPTSELSCCSHFRLKLKPHQLSITAFIPSRNNATQSDPITIFTLISISIAIWNEIFTLVRNFQLTLIVFMLIPWEIRHSAGTGIYKMKNIYNQNHGNISTQSFNSNRKRRSDPNEKRLSNTFNLNKLLTGHFNINKSSIISRLYRNTNCSLQFLPSFVHT